MNTPKKNPSSEGTLDPDRFIPDTEFKDPFDYKGELGKGYAYEPVQDLSGCQPKDDPEPEW